LQRFTIMNSSANK